MSPALPLSTDAGDLGYRTLGRTRLQVSQAGLGGGGASCLGRNKGRTEAESVAVVRRAIENFAWQNVRHPTLTPACAPAHSTAW